MFSLKERMILYGYGVLYEPTLGCKDKATKLNEFEGLTYRCCSSSYTS